MTTIIGIAGRKHAGKDTAASVLVEERGYTNIKFADGIKKAARLLFEFLDYEPDAIERLVDGSTKEVPIDQFKGNYSEAIFSDFAGAHAPELADILGISVDDFDNLDLPKFTGDTSREFQQFLGTEIGRNLIGESVWTDAALTKALEHPRVVISDVRFPNEVNAIRASGGTVIRVNRITEDTGFSNHPSEIYIDTLDVDVDIDNNHTLNDLYWSTLAASGELPEGTDLDAGSNAAFVSFKMKAAA